MVEVIAFPSAEAIAVGYVRSRLTDRGVAATVATKVPAVRPAYLVKVRRIGGVTANLVTDAPMLVFDCWAPTEIAAEDLSRVVRAEILAMPGQSDSCTHVDEVGGPVNQPDPDSNSPRYVFTVIIHIRGSVI
jgi:hypothetical protein